MTAVSLSGSAVRPGRVSRDMRTFLFGVACVVVMLVVAKGLPFLVGSRRATIKEARMVSGELAQDRQIVSRRKTVLRALDETTTTFLGLSPAFVEGREASQAAAALGSVVSDAADANGVQISSLQPEVDSAGHTMIIPVIVHASGTGDVRGISGMLRDLESSMPLVEVRQVTIAQPDPATTPDRMEALHVEVTVRGLYRRIPGGPDDGAAK